LLEHMGPRCGSGRVGGKEIAKGELIVTDWNEFEQGEQVCLQQLLTFLNRGLSF